MHQSHPLRQQEGIHRDHRAPSVVDRSPHPGAADPRDLSRSPIFREPVISEAGPGRKGEVDLAVSFGHGPTVFRVVAPSADEAYSILHELALVMVETDSNYRMLCRE